MKNNPLVSLSICLMLMFSCREDFEDKSSTESIIRLKSIEKKLIGENRTNDDLEGVEISAPSSEIIYSFYPNGKVKSFKRIQGDTMELISYAQNGYVTAIEGEMWGKSIFRYAYQNGVISELYKLTFIDSFDPNNGVITFKTFGPALDSTLMVSININVFDKKENEELVYRFHLKNGYNNIDTVQLSKRELNLIKGRNVKVRHSLTIPLSNGNNAHSPGVMDLPR